MNNEEYSFKKYLGTTTLSENKDKKKKGKHTSSDGVVTELKRIKTHLKKQRVKK